MEVTLIAIVFLLWLMLGGFVALLVCPLLKEIDAEADKSPSVESTQEATAPHAPTQSYR
jgi:hypothetical protein